MQRLLQITLLIFFYMLFTLPSDSPASDSAAPGIEQTKRSDGKVIPLITVFGSSQGPGFIKHIAPRYPLAAKRRGLEGRVLLRLAIDERGALQHVEVVEATDAIFVQPAVDSVKQSSFHPAQNNGRAAASQAELPICFRLKHMK